MISNEITIERDADFGIILEKNYTLQIAYEYLLHDPDTNNLMKVLNPIWGEEILYFDFKGKHVVAVSAKGAPIAVNAVERIRRTGGKVIVLIGTCGSTNESIIDGTIVLANAAVRDEGVSKGYLDLRIPACSDMELNNIIVEKLKQLDTISVTGVAFTTDKRYKEDSNELEKLNKQANVIYVDMETSAVLLVSAYHGIRATAVKVVTDCAVKKTSGELKGVFDRRKNFISFTNPKLLQILKATLNAYSEL